MKPLWEHQQRDIQRLLTEPEIFNTSDPGCVSGDTEYLSPTGWKRIDTYHSGKVAQFLPNTKEIEWVEPTDYIKRPCVEFFALHPARGTSQVLSAEHRVLYYQDESTYGVCSAKEFFNWHTSISNAKRSKQPRKFATTFSVIGKPGIALTSEELRLQVACIADGYFTNKTNTKIHIRLKKERKKDRLEELLNNAGIDFTKAECLPYGFHIYKFYAPRREKIFSSYWYDCTQEQLEIIADECQHWDSSTSTRPSKGRRFSSYSKESAEFIQYACSAAKMHSTLGSYNRERRALKETEYVVHSTLNKNMVGPGRKDSVSIIPSEDGYKYCFEVPSTFLLLRHNGYIFATGNTGKTRVVIEAIKSLNIPTLILAPKSILSCAWGNDFFSFAHEVKYSIATATNRRKAFQENNPVVITNHDAVSWLVKPENVYLLNRFKGGILVVDESTCFKNPSSARSKAAAKLRKYFDRCICMSGTPTPQGIIDIWHQVFLVDQGQLLGPSFYRFRSMTHDPINKGAFTDWKEKPGVYDAVCEIVAPITIRNKREDCMDLPDNLIVERSIELNEEHMEAYRTLRRQAILEVETGEVVGINAAVLRSKLLQLVSGAVYGEGGEPHLIGTDRYELIMDLVEERSHSVVIFLWRHQRDQLLEIAKKRKIKHAVIDGSVSSMNERTHIVNNFQNGDYQTLFIHPQSAGHGITLTKGVATIWASPTDNSEWFLQANARIYRGGQTQKTETILISAKGTIEEKAYKALTDKVTNMSNLLELLE